MANDMKLQAIIQFGTQGLPAVRAARQAVTDLTGAARAAGLPIGTLAAGPLTAIATVGRTVVGVAADMARKLALMGAIAGGVAAAGLAVFTKQAIDAAAYIEQSEIAFGSLLKSTQGGRGMVKALEAFAAGTPFEFSDLITRSKQLLAYGFGPGEMFGVLTSVGDAVAALGGGADVMERLLRAIGQIRGKGKVMMQEMYQVAETGIPIFEILAEKLGLTQAEVAEIGETGVSAEAGLRALFQGLAERYGGTMQKQMKTVSGMVSNFKDVIFQLKAAFGKAFIPMISDFLPRLIKRLDELKTSGALERIGSALAGIANVVLALVGVSLEGLLTQEGLDRLTKRLNNLRDWLQENLPKAWAVLTTLARASLDWIGKKLDLLIAEGGGLIGQFLEDLSYDFEGAMLKMELATLKWYMQLSTVAAVLGAIAGVIAIIARAPQLGAWAAFLVAGGIAGQVHATLKTAELIDRMEAHFKAGPFRGAGALPRLETSRAQQIRAAEAAARQAMEDAMRPSLEIEPVSAPATPGFTGPLSAVPPGWEMMQPVPGGWRYNYPGGVTVYLSVEGSIYTGSELEQHIQQGVQAGLRSGGMQPAY